MMIMATTTKSLRLTEEETAQVERLQGILRYPTEAALLKRVYLLGLEELRIEAAIRLYTHDGFSLGETAEAVGLPIGVMEQEFARRHIRVFDAPEERFLENLEGLGRRLGLTRLEEAARDTAGERSGESKV